jgi:hypothetical protein
MVEIYATDEMTEWYQSLSVEQANAVDRVVRVLAQMGLALGHPYSSAIRSSRQGLRELRVSAGKAELRVLYAFDPRRDAVLLLGGDKSGDARFYEWIVPLAERVWKDYLAEQKAGKHDEE